MSGLLLDTCALICSAEGGAGDAKLRGILSEAWHEGRCVSVSSISAWEVANLARSSKIAFGMEPLHWFEAVVSRGQLDVLDLTTSVLVASSALPELEHRDPADRIIIATARSLGYRIVTRDRKILDYSARGHVMALAC